LVNKTAILVDGAFFLKRYSVVYGVSPLSEGGKKVAQRLYNMIKDYEKKFKFNLYRTFYYDALPFMQKAHNPISKKSIDFFKTELAVFRLSFFEELKRSRKVALRLGDIKKGLVDQIILISGDSNFVPAIKVARKDGIDFILDPMHQNIDESLFEHIDGLHSVCPKPKGVKAFFAQHDQPTLKQTP
jgi:uncharacterized LabA/DUF88 family protein